MSEELKLEACPFCGADSDSQCSVGSAWACGQCGAVGPTAKRDGSDGPLIRAWNRRSPSPEFAALVDAVDMLRGDEDFHEAMVDSHPSVGQRIQALFDAASAAERALSQQK